MWSNERKHWSYQEVQKLQQLKGQPLEVICSTLGRTQKSIAAKLYKMDLGENPQRFSHKELDPTQSIIKQDERFQRVMLKAIKAGLEAAQIGVYKDGRPLLGRSFMPRPEVSSGCSSAAQACADMAATNTRDWG